MFEAQKLALGEQVQELKGELASARAANDQLDKRIQHLSELLDRERQARAVIERELAVSSASSNERPGTGEKERKARSRQKTLWQE